MCTAHLHQPDPQVLHDFEPRVVFDLEPVDAVTVTTLMDDVIDALMPDWPPDRRQIPSAGPGSPAGNPPPAAPAATPVHHAMCMVSFAWWTRNVCR